MVFGTFDGLHPGHLNLFRQAKKKGEYLIVVVARDKNVFKIKKHWPKTSEIARLREVRNNELVDLGILGQVRDPLAIIRKIKPEVICLGYDQKSFNCNLKKKFPKIIFFRLKSYQPKKFKSSKLN